MNFGDLRQLIDNGYDGYYELQESAGTANLVRYSGSGEQETVQSFVIPPDGNVTPEVITAAFRATGGGGDSPLGIYMGTSEDFVLRSIAAAELYVTDDDVGDGSRQITVFTNSGEAAVTIRNFDSPASRTADNIGAAIALGRRNSSGWDSVNARRAERENLEALFNDPDLVKELGALDDDMAEKLAYVLGAVEEHETGLDQVMDEIIAGPPIPHAFFERAIRGAAGAQRVPSPPETRSSRVLRVFKIGPKKGEPLKFDATYRENDSQFAEGPTYKGRYMLPNAEDMSGTGNDLVFDGEATTRSVKVYELDGREFITREDAANFIDALEEADLSEDIVEGLTKALFSFEGGETTRATVEEERETRERVGGKGKEKEPEKEPEEEPVGEGH